MEKGFILINKPPGWTSFDIVGYIRSRMKQKLHADTTDNIQPTSPSVNLHNICKSAYSSLKVGHAGTLDPFATGLLIIGIGREATKRLDEFKNLPKTYRAVVHLGAQSDTDDPTGTIIERPAAQIPSQEEVENVLKKLIGKQDQIPPMFSAKKIAGQRLYKLARAGKTVERLPDQIEIYSLKLYNYSYPKLDIEVTCSAGTYIRTLARTIGEQLRNTAYCETLERTAIGQYNLKDAKNISDLNLNELSSPKNNETMQQ